MASPPDYKIVRICTGSPRLTELAAKFRETKLAALEAEPTGFATKLAEEALIPLTTWRQRLEAPANLLICLVPSLSAPSTSDEDALIYGDWVGMCTMRGPLPYSMFHLPHSGQPVPANPDLETRWHLNNLYTNLEHRGRGLARRIVETGLEVAQEQTRALQGEDEQMKARVRLFFDPSKTHLHRMYSGLGFKEAGKITLGEAFVANGDAEQLPADMSSEEAKMKWGRRYGLSMERIVDA
ncbi:hypothetical protein EJ04DRAFT_515547 [Polyplosphaeria fusca]|uniref:N-acetyltransferase domain-containing protein n=1 Tax=Polyplosphaeria fusca TaxID=682080 RepID=A0A9P4QS97_9PLEO|nr:hypothetical protein EJ04DRAFT_515547 [Polyplosphaeria fusca]